MMSSDILDEIRSVFRPQMGNRADFAFEFLQPTGSGTATLVVPNVSASFDWTAQQVAKLSNAKGSIFILVKDKLTLNKEHPRQIDTK